MITSVVFGSTAGGIIPVCAWRTPNGANERTPARKASAFGRKYGMFRRMLQDPRFYWVITFRPILEHVNRSVGSDSGLPHALLVSYGYHRIMPCLHPNRSLRMLDKSGFRVGVFPGG